MLPLGGVAVAVTLECRCRSQFWRLNSPRCHHYIRERRIHMPCPVCGGNARVPIAPGYWECDSLRAVPNYGWEPVGPGGALEPRQTVVRVRCGSRYNEGGPGTSPTKCYCGTYAIGECANCGAAVCGDHSELSGGRRQCYSHFSRSKAAC